MINTRFEQKERWIGEGLEAIGDGIARAGLWIAAAWVIVTLIERAP